MQQMNCIHYTGEWVLAGFVSLGLDNPMICDATSDTNQLRTYESVFLRGTRMWSHTAVVIGVSNL